MPTYEKEESKFDLDKFKSIIVPYFTIKFLKYLVFFYLIVLY